MPAHSKASRPHFARTPLRSFLRGVVIGASALVFVATAGATGYVVKSAVGINLFPGKSVLHEPLWPIAVAVRHRIAAVRQAF